VDFSKNEENSFIDWVFLGGGKVEGELSGMHTLLAQNKKRDENSPSTIIVTTRSYPHKVSDNTI
jgi:hypothetical protein